MAIDTKQMITDKLFELLNREKPENITVKRLVEECGISRQTFYYHFQDIIDVMEHGCEQAMNMAFENSMKAATPREAITAFIVEAVKHRAEITHLLSSRYSHELAQILQKAIRGYIRNVFGTMFPNSTLSVADTEVALDFFTGGITGLILGNYAKRDLDTGALADQIYRLLSGEIRDALFGRVPSRTAQ